jgi:hypothetical protein
MPFTYYYRGLRTIGINMYCSSVWRYNVSCSVSDVHGFQMTYKYIISFFCFMTHVSFGLVYESDVGQDLLFWENCN